METLLHDDGVDFFGGETLLLLGDLGGGKTTLLMHIAQWSRYIEEINKNVYVNAVLYHQSKNEKMPAGYPVPKPETVIIRGGKHDNWSAVLPEYYNKNYPYKKKCFLYVHENDNIKFWHLKNGKKTRIFYLPEIKKYSDANQLKNLIGFNPGAIHIVYEPSNYRLNLEFWLRFRGKSLETVTKAEKERLKDMPVAPVIFWFEFFETLLRERDFGHVTVEIDEAHQMCPAGARGDRWHLNEWFINNAVIKGRKNNLTLILATQQQSQLDYRLIVPLANTVYLKGAHIPKSSMIRYKAITGGLKPGLGLIEKRNDRFGPITFPRLEKQPPVVFAEGVHDM